MLQRSPTVLTSVSASASASSGSSASYSPQPLYRILLLQLPNHHRRTRRVMSHMEPSATVVHPYSPPPTLP
ncbi:hypothetical protein BCR43DRAFT_497358 [Syncephalastrum racemosum]|uniref:Uncharacterized protein n=1 Tax=Syncephalastrum racemosum TaxID=13706 RepID=A0A1X2H212_SYNRA|nr:hypothetical protein BCR43DRAFT_497358 [Syncephalastrum racemosum]